MLFIVSNNTKNSTHEPINNPAIRPGTAQNKQRSSAPNHSKTVHKLSLDCPKTVPEIPALSPKFLGLKCTVIPTPNTPSIKMAFKQGLNQVREKPLPLGVCQNFSLLISTCSSCYGEALFFLLRRKPPVRLSENLKGR